MSMLSPSTRINIENVNKVEIDEELGEVLIAVHVAIE
jgi:hypothetical protein